MVSRDVTSTRWAAGVLHRRRAIWRNRSCSSLGDVRSKRSNCPLLGRSQSDVFHADQIQFLVTNELNPELTGLFYNPGGLFTIHR